MTTDGRRNPRVALVTHGFDTGGGVPTVARWLHDGLVQTGEYDVDIIDLATSRVDLFSRRITRPGTWWRHNLRGRCAIHRPHDHWGANAVEFEFMRYQPRRGLTRALSKYDLIQVVSGTPAWAVVARRAGVPVVLQTATLARWERGASQANSNVFARLWRTTMTRFTTAIEVQGLQASTAVVVENRAMHEHLRGLGRHYVVLAPPGVDTDTFVPSAPGRNADGHLLSVCRLGEPRKGLDRMVRAYARMVKLRPDVPSLVLAGKGRLSPPVSALIRELALSDRITVLSDVSPDELVVLYQGASAFLQTSHEEGLGISSIEAMACGLPVVATETAGSAEIVVDGRTGWLVPQDDEPGIVEGIAVRALDVLSPENRFGNEGRRRAVEIFSTAASLGRFMEVYTATLHRRGRSTATT